MPAEDFPRIFDLRIHFMKQLITRLWNDERGLVLSAELVFMASIVAIGMIVGLSAARDGVTSELIDAGSAVDGLDYCDTADDTAGADDACVVRVAASAVADETTVSPDGSIVP
jgi:Flp pilus assembly pilin Flp